MLYILGVGQRIERKNLTILYAGEIKLVLQERVRRLSAHTERRGARCRMGTLSLESDIGLRIKKSAKSPSANHISLTQLYRVP